MQTFLPYPSYISSLLCLDNKRLGKQRVECKQILLALERGSGAWYNHPATQMWRGYETALAWYGYWACSIWRQRNFKDSLATFFYERFVSGPVHWSPPPWLGDDRFHNSHKSNLLRKDPVYYQEFSGLVTPDLPYFWPTKHPDYAEYYA